jgi:phosphatidate cytidylyltransferase
MLRQRLASAALVLPVVIVFVWLGPWTYAILLTLITALGGWELSRLLVRLGWKAPAFVPLIAVLVFVASIAGWLGPVALPLALAGWLFPLIWLFRPVVPAEETGGVIAWLAHAVGALYVGMLLAYLAQLQPGPWSEAGALRQGPRLVFYALAVIFACDTGAYAAGRLWGSRRLWPAVSPKKTWEGAAGGLLAAILAGAFLARPLADPLTPVQGGILGALAGAAGQLGDLVESRLKRKAAVKDSGTLFPGHGGMLDRLDSVLFAAPLFYYGLIKLAR